MPDNPKRILILGGTADARILAARLDADARYAPVSSLAGVTSTRADIAGETRMGGFGGADGIADFVSEEGIDLVVDATHPFAIRISANAAMASGKTGVPCLRLERPEWERQAGDDWIIVPDVEAAVRAIPEGARAFVTVGRQNTALFFTREDIQIVARMIDPPEGFVPIHAEIILGRPPFTVAEETELMRRRNISVLVAKNAGGTATYAKIEAARELGVPVIMVSRPQKVEMQAASTVDDMLLLIEQGMA